jgi:hypothetical protein
MADGDRTKKIRDRIQLLLGIDDYRLANVNVYGQIDDAQRFLCEETLCREKKTTSLAFTSGAASEPSGFYKIKQIVLSSTANYQPTEISVPEYDAISRLSPTVGMQAGEYYFRWGGTITTYPAVSDGNYTMYYYGIPTTNVAAGTDPETPAIFDRTLEYLAARDLAPVVGRLDLVSNLSRLFAEELDRAKHSFARTKISGYQIQYHDV